MERLTIKELAAYLPFKLQWKFEGSDEVHEVMGIDITDVGVHLLSPYGDYGKCRINEGKPLLRPLSSLTEERQFGDYWSEIEEIVKESEQHCDAYDEWLEIFIDDPNPSRILQAPYEIVQELLAQKFDVFNLIPRSLALPIDGKEVEGE